MISPNGNGLSAYFVPTYQWDALLTSQALSKSHVPVPETIPRNCIHVRNELFPASSRGLSVVYEVDLLSKAVFEEADEALRLRPLQIG